MTDVERPTKVRKNKRSDTIAKPEVVIEMAEPVTTKKEDEEGTRNRTRQLTVEEAPFEFLTPQQKEELIKAEQQMIREAEEREANEKENAKKARVMLGLVLGAGLGMFAAYLVKKNLFSATVEAAIETVNNIVDES